MATSHPSAFSGAWWHFEEQAEISHRRHTGR
jgi:hypothetical protein